MSWFLLQSVEQCKKREKEDIASLERILDEKHRNLAEKRKKVDG